MNAVIYARYSSDNQREESIEGQLRECEKFAQSKGLTIVNTYIDRALSAKTDNRPEFQRMIKDSAKASFETVLVWKLDRFARNRYDSATYKAQLRKNNVKVISATEAISDDATGILLESLLEGFAEYYSAELSEKVARGHHENALKCKFNGGSLTYGYKIDENQMYQLDPLGAPNVLEAFNLYNDGYTMKEICDKFKEKGIKNFKGNDIRIDAMKKIFRNRKYIGEYIYKDVVIENGIPAIVPRELFLSVQEKITKNAKAPARHKATNEMYLLTTKLHCGKCGCFMVGESGIAKNKTQYQYYKCTSAKKKTGCDKKAIRKDYIENIVMKIALELLYDEKLINEISDKLIEFQSQENSNIPRIKKQISEVTKAANNILAVIEQGVASTLLTERLIKLEKGKTELKIALAQEEIAKPLITKDQLLFWFDSLKKIDVSTFKGKQKVIDVFINSIYLYDDKIVVTFNHENDQRTISLAEIENSDLGAGAPP